MEVNLSWSVVVQMMDKACLTNQWVVGRHAGALHGADCRGAGESIVFNVIYEPTTYKGASLQRLENSNTSPSSVIHGGASAPQAARWLRAPRSKGGEATPLRPRFMHSKEVALPTINILCLLFFLMFISLSKQVTKTISMSCVLKMECLLIRTLFDLKQGQDYLPKVALVIKDAASVSSKHVIGSLLYKIQF